MFNIKANKRLTLLILCLGIAVVGVFYSVYLHNKGNVQPTPSPIPITKHPELKLVGEYLDKGEYYKVFVSGSYAYATRGQDLHIIDVSNPAQPKLVGEYIHPVPLSHGQPMINHVFVLGNYAYLSTDDSFQIVDVSDKTNPKMVGIYDRTKDKEIFFRQSFVNNGYAYIANSSYGLLILDISNPKKPTYVGKFNPSGHLSSGHYIDALSIFVLSEYAYVADDFSGLLVLDVSDPRNLVLTGISNTPSRSMNIYIHKDLAILANREEGIDVIDISEPAKPIIVGIYNEKGFLKSVYVLDDYAYLADDWSGVHVIDISNPSNPVLVKKYDIGNTNDVTGLNSYLYLATREGLKIFKIEYK